VSTNGSGAAATGASANYSILSPSTNNNGTVLSGTDTATINFWQPTVSATCCPSGTNDLGYSMYAENVYAIADVDGDGLQDAITDTPVRFVATNPALSWLPYVHFLSLRTSLQAPDGTITPFGRAAPNNVSKVVPPFAEAAPLAAQYNNATVTAVPTLPAAGQYVAEVRTDNYAYPTIRLLGDADWNAAPDQFIDAQDDVFLSTFMEDVNGDGLVDWVTLNTQPPNTTTTTINGTSVTGPGLLYWIGHGDGTFGSCVSGKNDCTGSARFAGAGAPTAMLSVPPILETSNDYPPPTPTPGNTTFLMHDVTGDGFPDLLLMTTTGMTLYINKYGSGFDGGNPVAAGAGGGAVPVWNGTGQVFFGDMNGSGVDDIIVIQGTSVYYVDVESGLRPGLLTSITNGYGATTTLTYATTHDLQLAAVPGGGWTHVSPQILHHVTKVVSTNGFAAGASTPFAETRTVDYAYAEPIYDGRDRQFVGFQTVTTTEEGDATQPSRITQTTFLSGICEVDQSISTACPAASADRPYRLLRGLPVLTDVYDSNLRHLSATHTQYDVHASMGGLDGRDVRFAYPQQVTTFLYDPSAAIPSRTALAQTDATFDEGITSVSNSYRVNSSASSPYVQLVRTQTRDAYGNVTDTNDEGRAGIDSPIHQTTTWSIPSGDPTQWQWRPQTRTRAAAVATAGAPADLPLALSYVFFPDGMVQTVSTTLTGATPLARATSGAAPTPYTAVTNGTELQYQKEYDIYGNPNLSIGPGGTQCSTTEYDATFSLLPTSQLAYRDGCYTAAVVTSQSWDLGLERVTLSVAANQATTQYSYDGFGRLASMIQPNVVTGGPGSGATTTVTYPDASGPSGDDYPVHQTSIVIQDGTNPRQSYQYYDGWGQPLVTVSQADPTAGDALPWVVSGIVQHSARGSVARAYSPTFWTGAAGAFPFAAALPGTSASATYDAFGHMLTETGLDGQVALSATYHALEQDFLDADQLPSAAHAGAMSKILFDGHGRTIAGVRDVHTSSGAIDAITTATVYSTAGSPLQITQSDSVSGTAVVRTMQYDSLGHLVSNVEPNTSSGGVGWRYVYDQSGDLVGTSDARGCGENLTYDGLGRVRWEDYSPCTTDQATYTSAPSWAASTTPTSASGVETFYAYDAPGSATVLNGELYGVYDRAASTSFTYDGRGRMTGTSRQLATPTWTSTGPIAASTNYSSAMFSKTFSYDGLNRPIGESSGADAATLLGTDMIGGGTTAGESLVTGSYSARGILSTVKGSYGTIVASNVVDADGLPLTAVFGDAAGTTVANCYDAKRQLGQLVISRHAALPQCAHAAIGAPSSPAATAQTVLVSDTFVRDAVGNPTSIADGRVAAEWEPGSMPVSRSFQYDDSYRVTQAGYSYATASGGDTFVSPLASVPDDFPMSLAAVTPRVSQQNFAYDWMGNTTSTTDDQGVFLDRSLGPIANGTATAGPNQIVSAGTYLVSGGTKKGAHLAAAYDAAGNTTSLELEQTHSCTPGACPSQFAYEWDEIGQLVHATRWDTGGTTAAADVHYVYDAFGQRVFRSSTDFGGIDFYNIEVFPSLRLENTAWNTTSSTYQDDASTEVAYLTLGGASYGRVFGTVVTPAKVTPPRKPATYAQAVFLEFTDSLGSTSAVVNKATGELVERTTYYAYGGVESDYRAADQSSFWEDYKFTGKENDLEVGLTYFGARYYSPELGRWLSPDPLAIHGASGDLNPYAYVQGRVTRSVDSLGLADEDPPNDPTGSPYSPPSGCDGNTMCLPDDYLTGYPPPQQQQNDPTTLQPSPSGQPTPPDPVDDGLTQAQRAGSPTDPNAPPDPSLTCQGASCSIAEHQESVVNDQFFQNPLGYFQYMTQHHGFMMGGTAPLVEDAAATIVQDVVPTVRNLQALGSVPGFQVHHILPQYLGKMLGYTVEQMVEHPGALISQWAHTGADNPNAVHKAISAALPLMADNARAVYTLEEISEGLKSAYQSIGRSSWFQSIEHLLK
jgi:RHS repeat-associated protein